MKRFITAICMFAMSLSLSTVSYAQKGEIYPHPEVKTEISVNEGEEKADSGRVWKTVYGEALRPDMTNGELRYTVYLPENYDSKKEYPFLLYLHGGSMGYLRTTGITPWSKDLGGGLQYAEIIAANIEDCIIFSPQVPGTKHNQNEEKTAYWSGISPSEILSGATENKSNSSPYLRAAEKMIADFVEKGISYGENTYTVDGSRLYVVGHSQGGIGTYTILRDCPGVFAAAIIGAGIGDPESVDLWKDTPVRIFHGMLDFTVSYEACEIMAEALKDYPNAEIFPLENADHNIKPYMYTAENFSWMAKQDRDKSESAPVIILILITVIVLAAGIAAFWMIKKRKTDK